LDGLPIPDDVALLVDVVGRVVEHAANSIAVEVLEVALHVRQPDGREPEGVHHDGLCPLEPALDTGGAAH